MTSASTRDPGAESDISNKMALLLEKASILPAFNIAIALVVDEVVIICAFLMTLESSF